MGTVLAALAGVVFFVGRVRKGADGVTHAAWVAAARQVGIELAALDDVHSLEGTKDGYRISLATVRYFGVVPTFSVALRVSSSSAINPRLTFLSDTAESKARSLLPGKRFQTGDASFDQMYLSADEEAHLVAMTGHRTRQALTALGDYGWVDVRGGVLTCRPTRKPLSSVEELACFYRAALTAARALDGRTLNVESALVDNVRTDPVAAVRLRSLEVLDQSFAHTPSQWEATHAAMKDAEPAIRLRAGVLARREGRATLEDLVKDPHSPVRADALAALVKHHPHDAQLRSVCVGALRSGDDALCFAAVRATQTMKMAELVPEIGERVLQWSPTTQTAVGAMLRVFEASVAEGAALQLFGSPHAAVREAVAETLGKIGTLRSVETLQTLSTGIGAPAAAARDAIRRIKTRLTHGQAGQVAVVGDLEPEGAVSVASEGEGVGAVAISPERRKG